MLDIRDFGAVGDGKTVNTEGNRPMLIRFLNCTQIRVGYQAAESRRVDIRVDGITIHGRANGDGLDFDGFAFDPATSDRRPAVICHDIGRYEFGSITTSGESAVVVLNGAKL